MSRAQAEQRIQEIIRMRIENPHLRFYQLATLVKNAYGISRRRANEWLRRAIERLAIDSPREMSSVAANAQVYWGEAWNLAKQLTHINGLAKLVDTLVFLQTHLPPPPAGAGEGELDEVRFVLAEAPGAPENPASGIDTTISDST